MYTRKHPQDHEGRLLEKSSNSSYSLEGKMSLEPRKRRLSPWRTQDLLKRQIMHLEKELEAQKAIRNALEKALNCQPLFDDPAAYKSLSKPAEGLINEVAVLEMEVLCLEKYLQSLSTSCVKKMTDLAERRCINDKTDNLGYQEMGDIVHRSSIPSMKEELAPGTPMEDKLTDGSILHRSHSSLSRNSVSPIRASPSFETPDIYHSLPLSMLERLHSSPSYAVLGNYPTHETPNWLSEEMVKCISMIYCHLADHPLSRYNSFGINGLKKRCRSFFPMVEIRGLLKNSQMLKSTKHLLHHYRSLISQLPKVDPRNLKHEEKLAFWINVHNSLVMHAFLVHGIPRGNIRRTSLVLKAAYIVGGLTVDIESIQSSILRCKTPRPVQWLNLMLFPRAWFKTGVPLNSYAIKTIEPGLRFALSTGCKSDPPIRIYTGKTVLNELEAAKDEYIQMNVKKLHKENKVAVPKNLECFEKDSAIHSHSSMVEEEIFLEFPNTWIKKMAENGRLWKKNDWIPTISPSVFFSQTSLFLIGPKKILMGS